MSNRAVALASTSPLIAALEERFLAEARDGRGGRESGALPPRFWEASLLGPLRDFLARDGKQLRARLVRASYKLAGGRGEPPEELWLLLEILHAGSLVIDDIEDGSEERRGAPAMHRTHGVPLALNAGNWLYFWALARVDELPLHDGQKLAIHRLTASTLLRCHDGQALDLSVRVHDLPQSDVARLVRVATALKTGNLTELAARLGAIAASADPSTERVLGAFGRELGVGLQMLDDNGSVVLERKRHKGAEDARHARLTWPFAWLSVDLAPMAYRKLRRLSAEVHGGTTPPDELLTALATELRGRGKERASNHLRAALSELRSAVPGGAFDDLERDVELLEQSHV